MEAAISNGFSIKRLKILNICSNLKRNLIIFLIVSAWYLNQGLSYDNTFSRFQTGDTVPLSVNLAVHISTDNFQRLTCHIWRQYATSNTYFLLQKSADNC